MSTRLLSTAFAATLALSLSGPLALAQSYTPPAGLPAAATVGASASPLIGQGYLPLPRTPDEALATGSSRTEQRLGGYRQMR